MCHNTGLVFIHDMAQDRLVRKLPHVENNSFYVVNLVKKTDYIRIMDSDVCSQTIPNIRNFIYRFQNDQMNLEKWRRSYLKRVNAIGESKI